MRAPGPAGGMEPITASWATRQIVLHPSITWLGKTLMESAVCFHWGAWIATVQPGGSEINSTLSERVLHAVALAQWSGLDEPYYTWMNVGIKARGHLPVHQPKERESSSAMNRQSIGLWPINRSMGRSLLYEQNNFGSYKSYHVFGRPASFRRLCHDEGILAWHAVSDYVR